MNRLLLVEDDPKLIDLVGAFLRSHGLHVDVVSRGDTAVAAICEANPDLVLLDLMLPGLDGTEVCRRARASGYQGVIVMLTARGDALDEIMGLEVGADDYVAKPVRPRVLLARIQAHLRRHKGARPQLELGSLSLDATTRLATRSGRELSLTTAEYELLMVLAKNAGQVLSRDELCLELRGAPWDGVDRSIDLRVSRLRKKLGSDGATIVKSVRGSGYLLIPIVP